MTTRLKPEAGHLPPDAETLDNSLATLLSQRRDAILQAIATCAGELAHSSDLQLSLQKAIERIGEATGVDRAHIFEIDRATRDGRVLQHRVWRNPELAAAEGATDLPAAGLGPWLRQLPPGRVVAGRARDFAEPVRALLRQADVRSILTVPVRVDDTWWGYICLDDCESERDWSPAEIEIIRTLADLVGGAVARGRHLASLADATRMIENSPTILYRVRPVEPYPLIFLSQNAQRYGRTSAELLASPGAWMDLIDREDRPSVKARIKSIVEGEKDEAQLDFRWMQADGSRVWFEGRGRAVRDKAGQVVAIEGVATDITQRKSTEEGVQFANALLTAQLECSPDGILVVNGDARIVSINRRFVEMWQIPDDLLSTRRGGPLLVEPGLDDPVLRLVTSRMKDPDGFAARVRYLYDHPHEAACDEIETRDGRFIDRHTRALLGPTGSHLGRIWFFRDITSRKLAQEALRDSEEKLRTVFASVNEGIFIVEPDTGAIVDVNTPGCNMFGYARAELIGREIFTLSGAVVPAERPTKDRLARMQETGPRTSEWHCQAKDGRLFWGEISVRAATFGTRRLILATVRDINDRKLIEAKMVKVARYDGLTGLANRAAFLERLGLALARARRGAAQFAILYLDLDHFKDVNDTLGHPFGDALLRAVAARLQGCVRDTDLVARFGGDEFAVLQDDLSDVAAAERLAIKIKDVLAAPYTIGGNRVRTTASIGIVPFSGDIHGAEAMMMKADLALYRAKDEGRNQFRFHSAELDRQVGERVSISEALHLAIERNEFELFFQPQVDLASGSILGLEALIRWNHPVRGLLLPGAFISIAETTGSILAVGQWVIDEACRQIRAWKDERIAPVSVAVNLSASQFKLESGLDRAIAASLARYDLSPDQLELELTESVLMETTERHREAFERLRRLGVRLAIDDFGTGYSSLEYLRSFRVARLKIDRRFVEGVTTSPDDAKIVRATIGLAHALGIEVVAEGVQTAEQRRFLLSAGCKLAQGYYFGVAMSAGATTDLLRSKVRLPVA